MEERNDYVMPVPDAMPEPVVMTMRPWLSAPRLYQPVCGPDTSLARKARKARARELTRQNMGKARCGK